MSNWAGNRKTASNLAGQVVALYGATCWLCSHPIDLGLPRRNPAGLSIDHVIPLALGGARRDLTNLRPAHLRCNQRRGARAWTPVPRPVVTAPRFCEAPYPAQTSGPSLTTPNERNC